MRHKTYQHTFHTALITLLFLPVFSYSQPNDTNAVKTHSPKKATIMSAILPGLGQAYNRKCWKIPIIYAGFATGIYFIDRNKSQYNRFRQALLYRTDNDSTTVDEFDVYGVTEDGLKAYTDASRRWLDISYIATAGVYILNIIDACVDAHFFYFDVSDDLTLHIIPVTLGSAVAQSIPVPGIRLSIHL